MIFYRQLEENIKIWATKSKRKPLIIRGARQVGKTTLINKIGQDFDVFVSLNLEKGRDKTFFEVSDDVHRIFDGILLSHNTTLRKNERCLLFIDEIQQSPKAIKLLRYFYEELPEIHVIAAGSLLEFALNDVDTFPVGRVEQLLLHPLNFGEYLQAIGKTALYEKFSQDDINEITYPLLQAEFDNYVVLGGMPEVVAQYIDDGFSFKNLSIIFENIWISYLDDTLKYGKNDSQKRILRFILQASPFTLDRLNFTNFGQNIYKSREIADGFRQLERAKILQLIYPTTNLTSPAIPDFKKRPRIQLLDTGLLLFINKKSSEFLLDNASNAQFRGQIYNHIALQEAISVSNSLLDKVMFWTRESSDANAELDLVLEWQNLLVPVEIKSGATGRLRSLHEFMDRTNHDIGVRLLANRFSIEDVKTPKGKPFKIINLPVFMASRIAEVLKKTVQKT